MVRGAEVRVDEDAELPERSPLAIPELVPPRSSPQVACLAVDEVHHLVRLQQAPGLSMELPPQCAW